jgi:hypothetical protein
LPSAIDSHSAVENNGYIYTTGGYATGGNGGVTSTIFYAPTVCNGNAITDSTVLVNSSVFTRFENTNSILGKTAVSIKIDLSLNFNATGPENQYSQEEVTTVALRN